MQNHIYWEVLPPLAEDEVRDLTIFVRFWYGSQFDKVGTDSDLCLEHHVDQVSKVESYPMCPPHSPANLKVFPGISFDNLNIFKIKESMKTTYLCYWCGQQLLTQTSLLVHANHDCRADSDGITVAIRCRSILLVFNIVSHCDNPANIMHICG